MGIKTRTVEWVMPDGATRSAEVAFCVHCRTCFGAGFFNSEDIMLVQKEADRAMPITCPHCHSEEIKIRKGRNVTTMTETHMGLCSFCGKTFSIDASEGELTVKEKPADPNVSRKELIGLFRLMKTHAEMACGCTSDKEAIKFMAAGIATALSVLEGKTDIKRAMLGITKPTGNVRMIRLDGDE